MKLKKINTKLVEGLEDIKSKYPNVSDENFYTIIKADPTYIDGSDELGRYGNWLLSVFNNREFNQEKLNELVDGIKELEQGRKELDAADNDIIVYEDDKWTVYEPKKYEDFKRLSSEADWARIGLSEGNNGWNDITEDDVEETFYNYINNDNGNLYVVISNSGTKIYCVFMPNPQNSNDTLFCYNIRGDEQNLVEFLTQYSELKECLTSKLVGFYLNGGSLTEPNDAGVQRYKLSYSHFVRSIKNSECERPSGEWWAGFIENDVGQFFDTYDDYVSFSTAFNNHSELIDDYCFRRMKELGCRASSLEELQNSRDPMTFFPVDVRDDVERAFVWAYETACEYGAAKDCWRDFNAELTELFAPLEPEYEMAEALNIYGTTKNWKEFILYAVWNLWDDYEVIPPSELWALIEEYIEHNFDCREPYSGWYGFEDDVFTDELEYRLDDIDYELSDNPDYDDEDDDEDYDDEDNEMIGKQFKFIYDKDRLDDSFKEYDEETVEILRSSGEDNDSDEPLWDIKIVDTGEVLIDIPSDCLKPLNESLEESLEQINEKNTLYRTESVYGSGVRKLEDVVRYEIEELGNTDIPETLLSSFDITDEQRKTLENADDTEDTNELVNVCLDVIRNTYPDAKYALWLAGKDSVKNYYDGNDDSIDEYETEYDKPISDLEDEGRLYVFSTLPNPIKESLSDKDDVEYKGWTIRPFSYTWKLSDKDLDVNSFIILSKTYIKGQNDEKLYMPLYCEDEKGNEVDFNSLEEAKDYIDKYISQDKGKIVVKHRDEIHYQLNDDLEESLQEDIEKHDTLNPLLWNEDGTLKEEVRDKLMQIVDEFVKGLEEDGITMDIDDIKIVGSNCSYNYTKDSDLDLHIVAKNIQAPEELYALLYSAYRSIWNKNYDIDFYGIPVEIFVETPELVGDEVTTIDVEV